MNTLGYNCFWANGSNPSTTTTDFTTTDPQLQPNSEFLKPTSPMLNAGEPEAGGTRPNVGARGVGIIASDSTKNNSLPFSNFTNWFEIISGAQVYVGDSTNGSRFNIVTSGNMLGSLQLNTNQTEGTIYSSVLDTGVVGAVLKASYFSQFENLLGASGSRATIDKDGSTGTITREIEYRVSSNPINVLDTTYGFPKYY